MLKWWLCTSGCIAILQSPRHNPSSMLKLHLFYFHFVVYIIASPCVLFSKHILLTNLHKLRPLQQRSQIYTHYGHCNNAPKPKYTIRPLQQRYQASIHYGHCNSAPKPPYTTATARTLPSLHTLRPLQQRSQI